MTYLLDTNGVSELTKLQPDPGLLRWLDSVDELSLFLSVVTIAELRYGVERLAAGRRKAQLASWLEDDVVRRFGGRVLPIDTATAEGWGKLVARCRSRGRPMTDMDAFIAATVERHDLTLVTRNVADFERLEIPLLSPWAG